MTRLETAINSRREIEAALNVELPPPLKPQTQPVSCGACYGAGVNLLGRCNPCGGSGRIER